MKVSPVKQFFKNNVKTVTPVKNNHSFRKHFDLYGKDKNYLGQYNYNHVGGNASISNTIIFNDKLKPTMQEAIFVSKRNKTVKDHTKEEKFSLLPTEFNIVRTTLDYINDKFTTVRKTISLKDKLQRIGKNDKDFYYDERYPIYEELKGKPKYESKEETIREGSISDVKYKQSLRWKKGQFPYIYW